MPKTKRFGTFELPDKITIYKNSILSISRDEADVRERIKSTVLHEIGHHFGLSDERLRSIGR